MGFESILRRRLGQLEALVPRSGIRHRPELEALWVRRGLGVELVAHPNRDGAVHARLEHLSERDGIELSANEAEALVGLSAWRLAGESGLSLRALERLVDRELVYWARSRPDVELPEAGLPEGYTGPLARRGRVWPTPAVETAVAIAPMRFMPRDRDLDGAELVGFRFATLDRGREILGSSVLGDARTGRLLSALLPRLVGVTAEELLAELAADERGQAERLLRLLGQLGVLEPWTRPDTFAGTDQISWLGHAAVLVQRAGHALLVDPCFHADLGDGLERPDLRALPDLDGVLITHGDNDHLNPNTLAQLPRSLPIYLPRVVPPPPAHQVDMEGMLRVLGFRDLRFLEPWEQTRVGPFSVQALPFDGEDWGLEQAQLTYLVDADGFRAFFSADSLGPDATYAHLSEVAVDLAFMGVSGASEPMVAPPGFGYGSFYERWIPKHRRGEFIRHTAGPAESAAFVRRFKPRRAFGYAAGGAPWIRTEYADRGDHAAFAAALEGSETTPLELPLGRPVSFRDI